LILPIHWCVCATILRILTYASAFICQTNSIFDDEEIKTVFKLPIWPALLKLCLCSDTLLGPCPLLCSSRHLWSQKMNTVYLHMNWCDPSIDQLAQVLSCVLFVNENLFSLCQYMGRNQHIDVGDMTQTEAVGNKTTFGRWLMLMRPLDKRSIPHAVRINISQMISCGI